MSKKNIFLIVGLIGLAIVLLGIGLAISGINIFDFIFSKTSLLILMVLIIVVLEIWRRSREK